MTVEAQTSAKMIKFDNRKENRTMKKNVLFSILCTVILLSGTWMHAEESEDYVPAPIRVVSAFLELTEDQVSNLIILKEILHREVQPLAEAKKALQEELKAELASEDPSADYVGRLVIEIHFFKSQIKEAHMAYVGAFEFMLDDRQLQKYGAIKMAVRLQRVIPAFEKLGLIGPGNKRPGRRATDRPVSTDRPVPTDRPVRTDRSVSVDVTVDTPANDR
jgi:hypothetical protein